MLPVEKTYENGMAIMNENEGSSDVVSEQYWPWPETVTRYHGTSYKFFFFFLNLSVSVSISVSILRGRKEAKYSRLYYKQRAIQQQLHPGTT